VRAHEEPMLIRRLPPTPIRGPRPIPLLGPAGSILRFLRDPIRCMRDTYARYGAVAAISDHDPSLLCAFGPENNRLILSNPDQFHTDAKLPIRVPEGSSLQRLSKVLVGMNGEAHHRLRRAMLPLFQKTHLETYRDDIVASAAGELDRWRVGTTLDISKAMAELSLCVSFRCLFGLDVSGDARILADLAIRYIEGATSPLLLLFPYDAPGSPYRAFLKLCEGIETRLREVIRERRALPDGRRDALSILIAAHDEDGSTLPDALLVGLASELFIAGHETTASTLAWTLFLLERHPRILADVLDELASVLHGEAPTAAQVERLSLLDAVVKESMRLLPAAPFFFFRRGVESARLGAYDVPADAALIISPLITHHMPEIYAEPRRFRPERWSGAQPTTYEYLPFGAGPRTCLGASFAALALRVLLAMILQRFRLTLEQDARVSFKVRAIVLGTKHGLPMRVEAQDRRKVVPKPLRGDIGELVDLHA
jgi:cytochrome P450